MRRFRLDNESRTFIEDPNGPMVPIEDLRHIITVEDWRDFTRENSDPEGGVSGADVVEWLSQRLGDGITTWTVTYEQAKYGDQPTTWLERTISLDAYNVETARWLADEHQPSDSIVLSISVSPHQKDPK